MVQPACLPVCLFALTCLPAGWIGCFLQEAPALPSRVLGADDLLPILCYLLAHGHDVETARPRKSRLTTLLAWCSAMADGGGGEGEWMTQAMHSALTHLVESAPPTG